MAGENVILLEAAERVNIGARKETKTAAVVVVVSAALASRIEVTVSPVHGLEIRDYLLWITFMSAAGGRAASGTFWLEACKTVGEDKSSRALLLDGRIQSLSLDAREGVS